MSPEFARSLRNIMTGVFLVIILVSVWAFSCLSAKAHG